MKAWYESRTVWVALAGMVTSVGTYMAGEIPLSDTLKLIFEGFLAVFIRAGIGLGKRRGQ